MDRGAWWATVRGSQSQTQLTITFILGFPDGSVGKEPACNAGDPGSIPGIWKSPWNGYPLQYSWLGNPMDRGAWQVIVHGIPRSQARLSD